MSLSTVSLAQTAQLRLDKISTCNNSEFQLPLHGTGLANIGALTLYINYHNDQLTFLNIEDIDQQLNGLIFNVLENPSRISIIWSNTNGADFLNGVLFNLKFKVISSSGTISFAVDSCEVATANVPPIVISVDYQNGSFFPGTPIIIGNPSSKTVFSQSNVTFNINSPDATGYKWQCSFDQGHSWIELFDDFFYEGTNTAFLKVNHVPVSFDGNIYRSEVFKGSCYLYSDQAFLYVDSLSGIKENDSSLKLFNLYPNPCVGNLYISSYSHRPGLLNIELFSSTGMKVLADQLTLNLTGTYNFTLNCLSLPVGIYICKLRFDSDLRNTFIVKKLVKVAY
jgi:hypothetical protein